MKLSFPIFLLIAAVLHLAAFASWSEVEGGAETGGQGGTSDVSLMAATPGVEAMVEAWDRPPETAETPDAPVPQPPDSSDPAPAASTFADAAPSVAFAGLPELSEPAITLPKVVEPVTPQIGQIAIPDPAPQLDPPEAAPQVTARSAPARPERPAAPAALAPTRTESLPDMDRTPPAPQIIVDAIPQTSRRPAERPKSLETPEPKPPAPAPRQASRTPEPSPSARGDSAAARPAATAAGSGGSAQAGTAQNSGAKTVSKAAQQRAISKWGAQIRARIERRKRHPGGSGGRVVVRLSVANSGQVTGAGIARSSGNGRLDNAALAAVRSAGRMPRAPAEIQAGVSTFSLPMDFN
ncbi:TonB family protein [Pseudooceanicola sp. C21-150M6]|uniref:cell envelope integrity protein TolA n=1 Tax=Pseudooceanicola sp. C21-150M6 TaxID=3434355 RepID=UPI003D7F24F6